MKWFLAVIVLLSAAFPSRLLAAAESIQYSIRGKPQTLQVLRPKGQVRNEAVLFMPGDGGWFGRAVEMAQSIADLGYTVYAFDVRAYLIDFTGSVPLSEAQMAGDLRSLAIAVQQHSGRPLILAGWSQGANMAVLAATALKDQSFCKGVVAVGLSSTALLGWRLLDNLTYITRQTPNEPTFSTLSRIGSLAPVPLAIIGSTNDEYISAETTQQLLHAAGEPKRFLRVEARNHRFDGNHAGLVQALCSSLDWIRGVTGEGCLQ